MVEVHRLDVRCQAKLVYMNFFLMVKQVLHGMLPPRRCSLRSRHFDRSTSRWFSVKILSLGENPARYTSVNLIIFRTALEDLCTSLSKHRSLVSQGPLQLATSSLSHLLYPAPHAIHILRPGPYSSQSEEPCPRKPSMALSRSS